VLAGLKSSAVTFELAPGGTPVASSVPFALLWKISLGQTLEAGQHLQLESVSAGGLRLAGAPHVCPLCVLHRRKNIAPAQ
jgi:hypothetical protein